MGVIELGEGAAHVVSALGGLAAAARRKALGFGGGECHRVSWQIQVLFDVTLGRLFAWLGSFSV